MNNKHMNAQGIGHSPTGTVPTITALTAIALIMGSLISGREEFFLGAASVTVLRFIADSYDRSSE